jgi:hypothetical protein
MDHALHTRNRAIRGAWFDRVVSALQVLPCVVFERDAGMAALLRTVMHQTIFTNVQVEASGSAVPGIGRSSDQALVEAGIKR